MSSRLIQLLTLFVGSLVGVSTPLPSEAQDYPSKPIRVIVPNNPGTTSDLVGRLIASEMPKFLGQQAIVENRPGADAIIGYEYVAKQAPADGYTIAVVFVEGLATLPLTKKDLRFDPLKDLPPFIGLVLSSAIVASSTTMPWKTINELVAWSKANPGKLNYGSSSSNVRLPTEALVKGLGLDGVHIAYAGGGPYLNAIASGELSLGFLSEASVRTFGDKVRVLTVSGKKLHAKYPNVPTLADLGFPQLQGNNVSLNVRAGTPNAVVNKLYDAVSRVLQQPETIARFDKIQFEIVNEPPEAARKKLAEFANIFGDIAKKVGIKPQ